jgi:carboxymethylenebutenolidase
MLHGRAGPYSVNVNASCTFVRRHERSPCNASTLTRRTKMWGDWWAERGVLAIAVDSFGPRGKGHGFGRNTHDDPDRERVNELTVRPLDAEGALNYLQQRGDVKADRIALQGWSNGASTTLNVMYRQVTRTIRSPGFRQALVFYPGCGSKAILSTKAFEAGAPTTVFLAADDEEVNPENCRKALAGARAGMNGAKGSVEIVWYDGATHDFDDPGNSRQSVAGNARAKADAMARAGQLAARMVAP